MYHANSELSLGGGQIDMHYFGRNLSELKQAAVSNDTHGCLFHCDAACHMFTDKYDQLAGFHGSCIGQGSEQQAKE